MYGCVSIHHLIPGHSTGSMKQWKASDLMYGCQLSYISDHYYPTNFIRIYFLEQNSRLIIVHGLWRGVGRVGGPGWGTPLYHILVVQTSFQAFLIHSVSGCGLSPFVGPASRCHNVIIGWALLLDIKQVKSTNI